MGKERSRKAEGEDAGAKGESLLIFSFLTLFPLPGAVKLRRGGWPGEREGGEHTFEKYHLGGRVLWRVLLSCELLFFSLGGETATHLGPG